MFKIQLHSTDTDTEGKLMGFFGKKTHLCLDATLFLFLFAGILRGAPTCKAAFEEALARYQSQEPVSIEDYRFLIAKGHFEKLRMKIRKNAKAHPGASSVLRTVLLYSDSMKVVDMESFFARFCRGKRIKVFASKRKVNARCGANMIVDDPIGQYFRIFNLKEKRYVTLEGEVPGVTDEIEFERLTHFNYRPFVDEIPAEELLSEKLAEDPFFKALLEKRKTRRSLDRHAVH